MKRTLIILTLLMWASKLFSQPFKTEYKAESKTETEIKEYLNLNISSLDPIEGIWSVEKWACTIYYKSQPIGPSQGSSDMVGSSIAIIKEGEKFIVYDLDVNFKPTRNYYESKGMPNQYFYHEIYYEIPHTSNATMDNLFSLEYQMKPNYRANQQTGMLIEMAKMAGEKSTNKFDVEIDTKYSKTFPKYIDYQNPITSKPKQERSTGTGFAISSNGYIATNYHVVDDSQKLTVRGINGDFSKVFNAKVILSDKNNDLAIIQIDDASFTNLGTIPYTIKTTTAEVGENINVLGYPLTATMGEEIKFTNGIISSKSGFQSDITCYQCSAPIQPGNSGGPMFDKNGSIIGIINAKHTNAENVSYAIKSTYLLNLIQSLPNPPKPVVSTLGVKSLTEQIKIISRFVFIIDKS